MVCGDIGATSAKRSFGQRLSIVVSRVNIVVNQRRYSSERRKDMGILTPTMALRWVEKEELSDNETPSASVPGYPECGPEQYKLQQAWVDRHDGHVDWRDIEIEYNP
jgi:hypothetical protein